MSLIDQLRERVEQTRADLESARRFTAEAKAAEDALASDLAGYLKALEAEERRGGTATPQATRPDVVTTKVASVATHDAQNKTSLVEDMIRAAWMG